MTNKQTFRIQRMATAAMLCALAYGCAAFSSLVMPIKIEGFLSLEIKDTVLMIGAFIFGPGTGLLMSVVVSLLELFTVSTTGWIGMVMNIVSSVMFICPAALVYKYRRTMSGAVKGLLLGAVLMTSGMVLWNYVMTPLYMNVEREMVVGMLLPIIVPFNLLKAALNGALTLVLYKSVVKALRSAHLLPPSEHTNPQRGAGRVVTVIALVCTVTLALVALAWSGIL
ncbi:MAG: ECF transporter S component [Clostridia bacterium]|nr:ECF transporter S component [Clostridia bacterium]